MRPQRPGDPSPLQLCFRKQRQSGAGTEGGSGGGGQQRGGRGGRVLGGGVRLEPLLRAEGGGIIPASSNNEPRAANGSCSAAEVRSHRRAAPLGFGAIVAFPTLAPRCLFPAGRSQVGMSASATAHEQRGAGTAVGLRALQGPHCMAVPRSAEAVLQWGPRC